MDQWSAEGTHVQMTTFDEGLGFIMKMWRERYKLFLFFILVLQFVSSVHRCSAGKFEKPRHNA